MDLREKINSAFETLTEEDFLAIEQDNELIDVLVDYIKNNVKSIEVIDKMPEDLIKKIVFRESIFNLLIDYLKEQDYDDFISGIFSGEMFEYLITPDNEKEAKVLIDRLHGKYFEEFLDKIKNDDTFMFSTSNETIINFIIDNKLYNKANCIVIKDGNVSKKIEDFLLEVLKQSDVILSTRTPKITEYCLQHNCIHRIIHSFNPRNPEELQLIKEAIENGSVTYEQIKLNGFSQFIIDSPTFIIQKICADNYLTEEQALFVANNPGLIKQIEELVKERGEDLYYVINDLARTIPELKIAFIKYNKGNGFYYAKSTLEDYITNRPEELLDLLNKHHDLMVDGIRYFLESDVSQKLYLARILISHDDLSEIRDIVFKELPSIDYSTLLFEYLKKENEYSLEKLYDYIIKNNISITLLNEEVLNEKLPFDIYIMLWKNITETQLNSGKIQFYNIKFDEYTDEQIKELLRVIIDKTIQYKSEFLNSSIYYLNQYARPEDIQRVVEHMADLKMDINSIINLIGTVELSKMSYQQLVEHLKSTPVINASHFNTIANLINEDNIEIIRWMLNSPVLVNNDYLYQQLTALIGTFNSKNLGEKYKEYLAEFYIKTGNIPARYTYYLGDEVILKATLNCDDEYYLNNTNYFTIDGIYYYTKENYFFLLFNKIKEKIIKGDKINFDLFIMCVSKNIIEENDIKFLLNSNALVVDFNSSTTLTFINNQLDNPLYYEYISNNVIPNITISAINNSFNLYSLMKYMPKVLDRFNDLANGEFKFNWKILKILTYSKDEGINKFIEKLYDNDLIDFYNLDESFFKIDYPIIDKIIINKVISDDNLLRRHVLRILERDKKYEDFIVKKINELSSLTDDYVIPNIAMYPKYQQAIIKAFKDGKININFGITKDFFDVQLLKAIIEQKETNIENIITFLVHNYSDPTKECIQFLTPYICKKQGLNEESFKYLYKIYGSTLISLLQDEKFILLCSQELEVVKRIAHILEPRALDKTMIEGINNSIRQNIFAVKNPQILTTFTTVIALIQNGTFEEVREQYLDKLLPAIRDDLENEIIKTNNPTLLNYYKVDKRMFLNYLFDCLHENQTLYSSLFNLITTNYITLKRNEFSSQDDIYHDTNVKYTYERKGLLDALFSYLLEYNKRSLFKYLELPVYLRNDDLEEEEISEYKIDYYTIQLLSGNDISSKLNKEELIMVKKNIKVLKERFYNNVNANSLSVLPEEFMFLLDEPEFESKLKKILLLPTRARNLKNELTELNVKTLLENIVNDKEKYDMLIEILNKYRLLDWGDLFEPTIKQLSIANEIENLYSFINAFSQIYDAELRNINKYKLPKVLEEVEVMRNRGASEEEIKKYMDKELKVQVNAYKILKYCSIYSSIANCYKIILGMEDFDLIKKNEGPNSSSHSIEERMIRAIDVHLKAIQQQEVSIPSFNTDKNLSSGKKLRAIVGNRAHPRNMTHGERTGACMRAWGYADQHKENDLFEFCATNFNGFHITFVNPETNEYVSRVSGFRNGNTVFLNQLRHVVKENKDYTNDDVIEAMKLVAQEIIEISKDSEYPIENVVASSGYALSNQETQRLSEDDIGRGVYIGYRDVNSNAVVLATTGKDGKAVPLDLDNSRHPHYKCVRVSPKEITGEVTIEDKINLQRISAIKKILLNSDNPEYINGIDIDVIALEEELVYAIIGQDWYITLNSNMEIKSDIINLDERAQLEFDEAMRKVEEYKNSMAVTGGLKNG